MEKLHQTLKRNHPLKDLDFFIGFEEIHFLRSIGAMG
jgi:hypothetical protein